MKGRYLSTLVLAAAMAIAASAAHAVTGLVWTCTDVRKAGQNVNGTCSQQRWDYADAGSLITTGTNWSSSTWRALNTIAPATLVLSCSRDIQPLSTECGPNYAGELYVALNTTARKPTTPPPVDPNPPTNPVFTGSSTLTWNRPTTNTDGSALTDLVGYRILYGTSSSALNSLVELPNPALTTYVVDNLTVGTWYFALKSYTSSGAESALSNVASKTIVDTTPPPVEPPADGSVTTDTVAYRLNAGNANKATFARIGTVPKGIACTKAFFSDAAGVQRQIIADRMRATLDSGVTSRPLQIYVSCR